MEKLQAIRGIGGWTAQYIAMRTMGWPDAFLETDAGVKHALPDKSAKELLALAEQVRTLLASFDPSDPAVAAVKASEAYQKVAHLIEGAEACVFGGLTQ